MGTLARQSRESTGGTLKMMALHKGLSRGQACMCTTSLEMATVSDGHYHLLCFWTRQSGVCSFSAHAECLLCLNLFHMVVLWHAGLVNVSICRGVGRLKGAPNCLEMTLTTAFRFHHPASSA